jgi:hypothetical protein
MLRVRLFLTAHEYVEDDELTIFEEWEDHRPMVVFEPRRTGYRRFEASHTAAAVGAWTVSRLTRVIDAAGGSP